MTKKEDMASDTAAAKSTKQSEFKDGMRLLASGVCIIAAELKGQRFGLASTAVSSVTADPPTLLVCVNRSASAHDAISQAGCFTINVLGESQHDVAEVFGSSSGRERRFQTHGWKPLVTGAPALEGALATFDCRIVQTSLCSSHTVFFGEVCAVQLLSDEMGPLLYWNRSYRGGSALTLPHDRKEQPPASM